MTLVAHNGVSCPSMMYGTAWKKEKTANLVQLAVEAGFNAIDTANQLIHYDEFLVGEALLKLKQNGTKRESLFLQTKFTSVNGQDHRTPYDASANLRTQVKQSMDSSLLHLHTDYLDSYILHGPYSRDGLSNSDWEVWQAIEDLYREGKTRIIGISNVSAAQLKQLCEGAKTKPMTVQNRCYATLNWDHEVREICHREGIIYQGFSLLTANQRILSAPQIVRIAERLKVTAAQVIFNFSIQIGMLPLTGTTNVKHMREDLQSVNLQLTPEEISMIEAA